MATLNSIPEHRQSPSAMHGVMDYCRQKEKVHDPLTGRDLISGIHCSCSCRGTGCLGIGSLSLCLSLCLLSLAGRALHGTAAACQQHGTHGHCQDSSQNFFHYLSFHNNVSSRKSVRLLWAAVDGLQ